MRQDGFQLSELEDAIDKVSAEGLPKLSVSQQDDLVAALYRRPFLLLAASVLQETNTKLVQLAQADLSTPAGITRATRLQGEIAGRRAFLEHIDLLMHQTEEVEK